MKGDFSTWRFEATEDHQGVLFQQGRVISDADLTDAEQVALQWRLTAGRDIVGANVAAVPAGEPDGYRVLGARVDGADVVVTLDTGRIWADGVHTWLRPDPDDPDEPVSRRADYLPEPHNPAGTSTDELGDGQRDAVVLELRLEELNAFQDPARLLEPALGGPDTAERIIPSAAIRLLRLGADEDCTTIGPRLRDPDHGRLTVSLEPPTVVAGDCPVVEGGGYSGFEHNLYRIEIARTDSTPTRFTWSRFNGGLVGRGLFTGGTDPHVDITANRSAILHSGLTDFYLEAVQFDVDRGHWAVIYGTTAGLNADGQLDLAAPPTFGTMPGTGTPVFFRLWDGIEAVADFADAVDPVELRDGIRLAFEPPSGASYRPGSWWNFDVRAGEIANAEVLIDDAPPEGPHVRRVPLAEINWTAALDTEIDGWIEDCRRRFRPLTGQHVCCTYVIGNGVTTFGDFNSLEEAAAHLPPAGGNLCLLPGVHYANLELVGRRGVHVAGCRHRTFVLPRMERVADPLIRVVGGQDIAVTDVDLIAPFGTAVRIEGSAEVPMREVLVEGCRMMALTHGIDVETAEDVRLLGNQIWQLDHPFGVSTISIRATDSLIEGNRTGVWPFEWSPPGEEEDPDEEPPDPADPCVEPDQLFANVMVIITYVTAVWANDVAAPPTQPYRARGGVHVKGGSERIDIRRNRIDGGLGHGITLGGVFPDPTAPAGDPVPPSDEVPVTRPLVNSTHGTFAASISHRDGTPAAAHAVRLTPSSGDGDHREAVAAITDEAGEVRMLTGSDRQYELGVEPGYEVTAVSERHHPESATVTYVVAVDRAREEVVPDDSGFITRIRIIDNEIEDMGLSGIGFWFHSLEPQALPVPEEITTETLAAFLSAVLAPRELLGTTNLVQDLVISGNRIENNFRAAANDLLRATALFVAQGGISLATVEGVKVDGNRIIGNGTSAVLPCAGVFIAYGEDVEIAGNHIAGNGPVTEQYRQLRSQGLRSGIFIRLAASVLAGGAVDGVQKPALSIRDNVVDQPAGRAITALAYGPVSLVGNTLNSEYEGAWTVLDELVGGVLIINIGGVHRLQGQGTELSVAHDFTTIGGRDGAPPRPPGSTYTAAYERRIEMALPGGETLVNSNRVRTGPENRSWAAQFIVTLDDLGYDGNQSGTFRDDITFANLISVAHSLRITDNRFRERALFTAMSALTLAGGSTVSGGQRAMNITTQNQGDHCIIAMSASGIPVEDSPNQVVFEAVCPREPEGKQLYVLAAFLIMWQLAVRPDFQLADGVAAVPVGMQHTVSGLEQFQIESTNRYMVEAERQQSRYGREHPRVAVLRSEVDVRKARAEALTVQRDLTLVEEAATPTAGVLLDGRVADVRGRSAGRQVVELVTARDEPLGISATTDDLGYYSLAIDDETRARIEGAGDVFVRVIDADGNVVSEARQPLTLGEQPRVRVDLAVRARPRVVSPIMTDGPIVFRRDPVSPTRPDAPDPGRPTTPGTPGTGAPTTPGTPGTGAPTTPGTPGTGAPTTPGTPGTGRPTTPGTPGTGRPTTPPRPAIELEEVVGIGPALRQRLVDEGVDDVRSMLALPDDELERILGARGPRLREAAERAVEAAEQEGSR